MLEGTRIASLEIDEGGISNEDSAQECARIDAIKKEGRQKSEALVRLGQINKSALKASL